jgi:molybdopterin-guanine dinucleotide biosynthesis protein A
LAVDLPGMTAPFLRKLTTRCTPLTGVVPMLGGDLEPLAAVYPKRCHAIAVDCIIRCRRAAKDFALACLKEKAVRPFVVAPSDAGCFANWNKPSDADLSGCNGRFS